MSPRNCWKQSRRCCGRKYRGWFWFYQAFVVPAWLSIRYPDTYDKLFREAMLKAKIWGQLHNKSEAQIEAREKELLVLLIVHYFKDRLHPKFVAQVQYEVSFTLYGGALL